MGRWLLHMINEREEFTPSLVIDSLRTRRQTLPLLDNLSSCVLIYLDANDGTRRQRYAHAAASDPIKATVSYVDAINHPTEREVVHLKPLAHLALDSNDLKPGEAVTEAINQLGLLKGP